MSVSVRRVLFSLLAAIGFAFMVPLAIQFRVLRAEMAQGPLDVMMLMELTQGARLLQASLLALVGLSLASGFLYAALSTGHERAWRPREDGRILCVRCGGELGKGVGRCPSCDQHLTW